MTATHVVLFKKPETKGAMKLVKGVTATGDVLETRRRVHAARYTAESAENLVSAIKGAGWEARAEPI